MEKAGYSFARATFRLSIKITGDHRVNATMDPRKKDLLQMLSERLERLNVDSHWARRASGTRGSVLRTLSLLNEGVTVDDKVVEILIRKSMDILTKAARDIPELKLDK